MILCGPVLRRVEADSVTVWVALSEPRTVTLRVYEMGPNYDGNGESGRGRPDPILIGDEQTVRLGARLHVACVTAVPAGGGGERLQTGEEYCYDLEFSNGPSVNEYGENLRPLLTARGPRSLALGYRDGYLPRFMLPPSDLSRLRIFHGSCRKPHATGEDALAALDDILARWHENPHTDERPHQLFLTGDQIYADDVADVLLDLLTPLGVELMGWAETVPGVNLPITDPRLAPGKREEIVGKDHFAKFTSGAAVSHLIALGEYYAMYVMVWSLDLWPAVLKSDRQFFGDDVIAEHETTKRRIKLLVGEASGPAKKAVESLLKGDNYEAIERFREQTVNVERFMASILKVRRVLANVPTYMMFDDHEVTDDWLLNGEWAGKVFAAGNALGPRILTNALTAYSIFQAWGNTPDSFKSGAGRRLLAAASRLGQNDTNAPDELAGLVGVKQADERILFDWDIEWPGYRVISLDTRTWRDLSGVRPGLINEEQMRRQVTDRVSGFSRSEVTIVISPAPVLGVKLVEEIAQPIASEFIGVFSADMEAWGMNRGAFQRFLRAMSGADKVVFLSGDVHYAFTIACEYWDERSGRHAVFAQLTSSSIKNESNKLSTPTYKLHKAGYKPLGRGPDEPDEMFGWETTSNLEITFFETPMVVGPGVTAGTGFRTIPYKSLSTRPVVVSGREAFAANQPPEWTYRVTYMAETRNLHPGRGLNQIPSVWNPPTGDRANNLGTYKVLADVHKEFLTGGGAGRQLVGLNNIGEVTFDRHPLKVYHRLWWRMPGKPPAPLTQHEITLDTQGQKPTLRISR
jgi:hypothetical protein